MISPNVIYHSMPRQLRLSVDYLYGIVPNYIKYGTKYRETKALLDKSQVWTKAQHLFYQKEQLKKLFIHSYEHVPYYKNLFDDSGFNPYSFKHLNQIGLIPLLDKNIIQDNFKDLLADNYTERQIILSTTGGTSGNQLKFYSERNYNQVELPFVEKIWERVGYKPGSRIAVLRNHVFKGGEVLTYDWRSRRLLLDNFHLNDQNIEIMLNKLCSDKIEYIHTYPSAIITLCEYIRRTGYKLSFSPRAILITSENIYSGQKELIEDTFHCRAFTFYGHSERACIAGWCEHSDLYHIQSEYGYMELIDRNQKVITKPDIPGEIVCTGFYNKAMPFIRYRTGDYSSYAAREKCICGRSYRLLNSIEGRWLQEMLVCKDGSKVSVTALNMHSKIFQNVRKYQLYQDTYGELILRIVKTDQYTQEDETNIRQELLKKLADSMDLDIEYVNDIEKTQIGKVKYLIQKLAL